MILHRKTIFRVLIVFLICLLVSLSILVYLIVPKTSFTPDVFLEHIERWKTDDTETFNSYSASELTMVDNSYIPLKLVNDTALPPVNGIIIGLDDTLYMTHNSANRVSRYDRSTHELSLYVAPDANVFTPDDLTIDPKGNLYITGQRTGEVYHIDPTGKKTIIAKGLRGPNGIRFNHQTGRLFMTECFEGNRVFELDPAGIREPELIVKENVLGIPQGFDFDPDTNDLIVPDMKTGKILRIHPDTGTITLIAHGFVSAAALKVGPDNMTYIVEQSTGAVFRLSLDGKIREQIAQLPVGLDNLAMNEKGQLFVTNEVYATVFEVKTDGSGGYEAIFPMGVGQPFDILYMEGHLYMSDFTAIYGTNIEKRQWTSTPLTTHINITIPSFLSPAARTIHILMSLFGQATKNMPPPVGLAKKSGDTLMFSDPLAGVVVQGEPSTGKFKKIIQELQFPTAFVINQKGTTLFVLEQTGNHIKKIHMNDGSQEILMTERETLAPTMILLQDALYVVRSETGEIIHVNIHTGEKNIFLEGGMIRAGSLAHDDQNNLLVLDGVEQKLYRVNSHDRSLEVIAMNLPISHELILPNPKIERPLPLTVSPQGDIFFTTQDRGLIMLKKVR